MIGNENKTHFENGCNEGAPIITLSDCIKKTKKKIFKQI